MVTLLLSADIIVPKFVIMPLVAALPPMAILLSVAAKAAFAPVAVPPTLILLFDSAYAP
jgi:hypothetical protein